MDDAIACLKAQRVVPIIRTNAADEAYALARIVIEAGLPIVELTMTIPKVGEVITACRRDFPAAVVAVGTVRSAAEARQAIEAGAMLLVTYKASQAVAQVGRDHGIAYILGAATPTEVDRCLELGSRVVKWFPAESWGLEGLKHLHGPLPEAECLVTGGIALERIGAWLAAGAVAVGLGGALLAPGAGQASVIASRVQAAMAWAHGAQARKDAP